MLLHHTFIQNITEFCCFIHQELIYVLQTHLKDIDSLTPSCQSEPKRQSKRVNKGTQTK